jgi:hypothetical protein
MSKKKRIAYLEQRIVELERRIIQLEGRSNIYQIPPQPIKIVDPPMWVPLYPRSPWGTTGDKLPEPTRVWCDTKTITIGSQAQPEIWL